MLVASLHYTGGKDQQVPFYIIIREEKWDGTKVEWHQLQKVLALRLFREGEPKCSVKLQKVQDAEESVSNFLDDMGIQVPNRFRGEVVGDHQLPKRRRNQSAAPKGTGKMITT